MPLCAIIILSVLHVRVCEPEIDANIVCIFDFFFFFKQVHGACVRNLVLQSLLIPKLLERFLQV